MISPAVRLNAGGCSFGTYGLDFSHVEKAVAVSSDRAATGGASSIRA